MTVTGARTDKVPTGPYRAPAGPRPHTCSSARSTRGARELGIEPVELRRRNLIRSFPHRTALGCDVRLGRLRALPRAGARTAWATRRGAAATTVARSAPGWRCTSSAPAGMWESATGDVRAERARDRAQRLLAPRPGPRDHVRADRRRAARHRPGGRRAALRRHATRCPRASGRSRAGRRRWAARRSCGRSSGSWPTHACSPPRCSASRPRLADTVGSRVGRRRRALGHAGRGRRGRRRPRGRGPVRVRPRVRVRRVRRGGRDRPRHRAAAGVPARRRRRRRHDPQPAARRGAGPRRNVQGLGACSSRRPCTTSTVSPAARRSPTTAC